MKKVSKFSNLNIEALKMRVQECAVPQFKNVLSHRMEYKTHNTDIKANALFLEDVHFNAAVFATIIFHIST